MFSYYGSKSKIINLYPSPKHGKVIEPFAGSARYALKYFDRQVLLVDKYPVLVEVWHYLQQASEADILGLPKPAIGDDLRNYTQLSEIEKKFMGYLVQKSQGKPANTVTYFSAFHDSKRDVRQQIAKQLYKIRHWVIRCGSYLEIENETATWFIDPPYQFGGEHQYKFGNRQINYPELGEWCKSRNGQIIVCENTKADWLPFSAMREIQGVANTDTVEAIWSNERHNFMSSQLALFTPSNNACSGLAHAPESGQPPSFINTCDSANR
jgi:site-specific DNA-adenine methylase